MNQTKTMKWIKILLIWFCFIPLAILNGGLREYIWNKYLPDNLALPLSGVLLAGIIYIVTRLSLPHITNLSRKDCVFTGSVWMLLTICFEFSFGLSSGSSWYELFQAYNPVTGNMWILVLLSTLCSPIIVYKYHKK